MEKTTLFLLIMAGTNGCGSYYEIKELEVDKEVDLCWDFGDFAESSLVVKGIFTTRALAEEAKK